MVKLAAIGESIPGDINDRVTTSDSASALPSRPSDCLALSSLFSVESALVRELRLSL